MSVFPRLIVFASAVMAMLLILRPGDTFSASGTDIRDSRQVIVGAPTGRKRPDDIRAFVFPFSHSGVAPNLGIRFAMERIMAITERRIHMLGNLNQNPDFYVFFYEDIREIPRSKSPQVRFILAKIYEKLSFEPQLEAEMDGQKNCFIRHRNYSANGKTATLLMINSKNREAEKVKCLLAAQFSAFGVRMGKLAEDFLEKDGKVFARPEIYRRLSKIYQPELFTPDR